MCPVLSGWWSAGLKKPKDIPDFVGLHVSQTGLSEAVGHPLRPGLFAKGRRRNPHHRRMPVHDLLRIAMQPRERGMGGPLAGRGRHP